MEGAGISERAEGARPAGGQGTARPGEAKCPGLQQDLSPLPHRVCLLEALLLGEH